VNIIAQPDFRNDPRVRHLANPKKTLGHDPEKWKPVFGQDHAQRKNLDQDPIQLDWILV
jgi:hypothetical protein